MVTEMDDVFYRRNKASASGLVPEVLHRLPHIRWSEWTKVTYSGRAAGVIRVACSW